MGYEAPELRVFRLTFEDRPGLEVAARSVTLERWMEITGLSGDDALSATSLPDDGPPPGAGLREGFAEALVSWNLTNGGKPVPATPAGLAAQDVGLVRDLVKGWLEAVSGVSEALGKDSGSGGTSPEESIPGLAESSQSLPSSGGPG